MNELIKKIIVDSADKGLELQGPLGDMPKGKNGPWEEAMTSVRNTAHWSLVFLEAYKVTGKEKYKQAVMGAAEYLSSDISRPMNATFFSRIDPKKDFCNGLIGQAWVLEALIEIGKYFKNNNYINLALEVFKMHTFDKNLGLWKTRNVDGSEGALCVTINQQIWFAVIANMLYEVNKSEDIKEKIDCFYENLNDNISLNKKGRIVHIICGKGIKKIKQKLVRVRDSQKFNYLEYGYHSFNLHGLAKLYKLSFEHKYWKQSKTIKNIRNSLLYTTSKDYSENIVQNPYSLSYNPSGFEIAIAMDIFSNYLDFDKKTLEVNEWINLQLDQHYSHEDKLMIKNTVDADTLSARVYQVNELLRY